MRHNVNLAVQAILREPGLDQIANHLRRSSGNFMPFHSILLAYAACGIAHHLGWGSEAAYFKLTMAACLHDLSLTSPDLARVGTQEELLKHPDQFGSKEVNSFLTHPSSAAQIAKGIQGLSEEIETIIAQHHEAPDGTGFPHGLTHTLISNFSAVFIVAEAFVLHMETASPTPSLTTFLHEKGEKYSGGAFRKIQEALLLMRKQSESPPNLSAA